MVLAHRRLRDHSNVQKVKDTLTKNHIRLKNVIVRNPTVLTITDATDLTFKAY